MAFVCRSWVAAASLLLGASALGADIKMDVQEAFEGFAARYTSAPVIVEILNTGPDAKGYIEATSNTFTCTYPVELPRGAHKLITTYPNMIWGDVEYRLVTDRGTFRATLPTDDRYATSRTNMLMISDIPGDLAFIKPKDENSGAVQPAYAKPERVPDRPVGLAGMNAVIMGDGAERLGDGQVEAVKLWVMSGGTLVFLGGASAPILNDPRWRDILPATHFHAMTVANEPSMRAMSAMSVPLTTYMSGEPTPGASAQVDGGLLLHAVRTYGLGRVLYLSFNPFDDPLAKWPGRASVVRSLIPVAGLLARQQFIATYAREMGNGDGSSGMPMTAIAGGPLHTAEQDPFSTHLPAVTTIFTVLGLYFLFVIPVNFLVLRKLRRTELAWFTAPVLSLVFAGILFSRAQGLYSQKLSTASQGLLVVQEGNPTGLFIGSSQMFLPIGGSYDLKLSGVDSVGILDEDDYSSGYPNGRSTLNLNPVDDGEIHVPNMTANNLAFREMVYRQKEDVRNWLEVIRSSDGKSYDVENHSPYGLTEGELYRGSKRMSFGSVPAGGRATVQASKMAGGYDDQGAVGRMLNDRELGLSAHLVGYRPGPQIGQEVKARTDITLVFIPRMQP